jgi:hypothetical protein
MTNAGKTFTVLGTDGVPGLLPRAVADIVDAVTEANAQARAGRPTSTTAASGRSGPRARDFIDDIRDLPRTPLPSLLPGESLSVTISCLEVYNDQVFDALVPPPTDPTLTRPILKVKDGLGGRCVCPCCSPCCAVCGVRCAGVRVCGCAVCGVCGVCVYCDVWDALPFCTIMGSVPR